MARRILGFCAALVLIFAMAACSEVEPYDVTSTQTRGTNAVGGGGGGGPTSFVWFNLNVGEEISSNINSFYNDEYKAEGNLGGLTSGNDYIVLVTNVTGKIEGMWTSVGLWQSGLFHSFRADNDTCYISVPGDEGTSFDIQLLAIGGGSGTGGGGLPDFGDQAPVGFVDNGNWGPGLKMFELSPNPNENVVSWTDTADVYFVGENGISQNFFSDAGWAIIPAGFTDTVYAVMVTSTPDDYEFSFQETDPAYSSYALPVGKFYYATAGNGEIETLNFAIGGNPYSLQAVTIYTTVAAFETAAGGTITIDTGDNTKWEFDDGTYQTVIDWTWNLGLECFVYYNKNDGGPLNFNLYAWESVQDSGPDGSRIGVEPWKAVNSDGPVDLNSRNAGGSNEYQWEIVITDTDWYSFGLGPDGPVFTVIIDFNHATQEVDGLWVTDIDSSFSGITDMMYYAKQ